VQLNNEQPKDHSSGLLEAMCHIKEKLQSIKEDNKKVSQSK
jgi:hypothetical protein